MRPLRFLLTLLLCILAFYLLLWAGPWRAAQDVEYQEQQDDVGAYFNWRTPSSLFPPSAIISLTDDNSTFFLARPAAFGPTLPTKSLSGQLWIGSGFGDDRIGHGNYGAGAEGELGCSDVPGWDDGTYRNVGRDAKNVVERKNRLDGKKKRGVAMDGQEQNEKQDESPTEEDGTDDHLHHPLPASDGLRNTGDSKTKTKKPTHADIQSIQESAEIAGKIVLLSRGGCGFLEKAKWVQRRGGIALIVGDDIRGGPLVTMYARGDTSNVTVPSLFTSHTTAHLLSSLIPTGEMWEELEDATRLGFAFGAQGGNTKSGKQKGADPKKAAAKSTHSVHETVDPLIADARVGKKVHAGNDEDGAASPSRGGWWQSLFGGQSGDSHHPPSSKAGWVLQEEFEDEDYLRRKHAKLSSSTSSKALQATSKAGTTDGFRIGVQDWRDPDLVAANEERMTFTSVDAASTASAKEKAKPTTLLKGGSITPGSGQYGSTNLEAVAKSNSKSQSKVQYSYDTSDEESRSRGWLSRLFHPESEDEAKAEGSTHEVSDKSADSKTDAFKAKALAYHRRPMELGAEHHEGLWVTLTPTSMSSSPFFDTLLVLVVSPLVTLTIVYALLLLRSRIRRRRWRAPKSVVERLPVRTYQTIATPASPGSTQSATGGSDATAATPLLPSSSSRTIAPRSRPRSWTVAEGLRASSSMRSDEMASPSLEQVEEMRAAGLAEWRRRYGGKQRECVVCLEEYVDGVSRVMSLPCGHEFHAECITPWLTTRRRTCPICKGDVVRSLARSQGSTASRSHAPGSSEEETTALASTAEDDANVQAQAALLRNEDPVAMLPVASEDDLERGLAAEPDRDR